MVLTSAIEGKHKESDASKNSISKSQRQARLEKEHDDMLEKITKIRNTDFDNTKRIERPEDVLERRQRERESRNKWYNRAWRYVSS